MSTWRSTIGAKSTKSAPADDDDWETDPDFVVSAARAIVAKYPYMVKLKRLWARTSTTPQGGSNSFQ